MVPGADAVKARKGKGKKKKIRLSFLVSHKVGGEIDKYIKRFGVKFCARTMKCTRSPGPEGTSEHEGLHNLHGGVGFLPGKWIILRLFRLACMEHVSFWPACGFE